MGNPVIVTSVNISKEKGTIKMPVPEIILDDRGVANDAHAGDWHRQISILGQEDVNWFSEKFDRVVMPGEFAENITLEGLDLGGVAILDRFRIGTVELEITQIGKECHGDACAIFREVGQCVMPKKGLFARVVRGGPIRAGDEAEYLPRPFRAAVITMSDRASKGEYEDRSGPRVLKHLDDFFADKRWHFEGESHLLPDDREKLEQTLGRLRDANCDLVIVTGGTGIGPRDFTPDAVLALADREIPGIMDAIRLKFGVKKPTALLSRSVACVMGTTQVYALPGSVKAVDEYMGELLKTVEHIVGMLHGLGH